MYAETELLFPFFQNFSQEVQLLDDFCGSHKSIVPLGNLVQTSTVLEYDLGGEGDLFKAPEPIIEEIFMGIDPMEAVISMISCGEDVISTQALEAADIESNQIDHLSEIFYDCKRDILAKEGFEDPLSDILDITIPLIRTEENLIAEDELNPDGPFLESVSSGCLTSMDWIDGMRRSLSEGDIETLGNGHVSLIHSPLGHPQFIGNCASEDRKQKLSRYRNKKTKRNFGRKIKYACRKALADSQPRIRGRFARTEESEFPKKQLL